MVFEGRGDCVVFGFFNVQTKVKSETKRIASFHQKGRFLCVLNQGQFFVVSLERLFQVWFVRISVLSMRYLVVLEDQERR